MWFWSYSWDIFNYIVDVRRCLTIDRYQRSVTQSIETKSDTNLTLHKAIQKSHDGIESTG